MDYTRRDFIKVSGISLTALFLGSLDGILLPAPPVSPSPKAKLGRITHKDEPVYDQPDLAAKRQEKLAKDTLVELLEIIASPSGPAYNPRWYRIEQGFLHSAHVQRVDDWHTNTPPQNIPLNGLLGEITVPYSDSQYLDKTGKWKALYRLYYSSLHWIVGLETSLFDKPMLRLMDEWLKVSYLVDATHVRLLEADEFSPLSPEVPPQEKLIEVSLKEQKLTAYVGNTIVHQAKVSTGKKWTPTRTGETSVQRKFPSKHMGNGALTNDPKSYELVGVPWVSFFQKAGIAFHGTFWHDNFGTPMSMGCVNLANEDARWIFRWTNPVYAHNTSDKPTWKALSKDGTRVRVV